MPAQAIDAKGQSDRIRDLLTQGGDERLALDRLTGRNRYGCAVEPDRTAASFASSTASSISDSALREVIAQFQRPVGSGRETYAQAADATRSALAHLCGLPLYAASNIILAPSGTDLHAIVADLARGPSADPLHTIMADPHETGRGVPLAVSGRRFATASPHGGHDQIGDYLPGVAGGETAMIALRDAQGNPLPVDEIDGAFEAACTRSLRARRRTLLILVDVSKTGLIAPSPACAAALKARHGEALTVLVDACQFRLSSRALTDYLAAGFQVAITGSKFVAGPAFSGALVLPDGDADRLRRQPISPALSDYSGREDWPSSFVGRTVLADLPNFGLLARWAAALHELRAFRALPEDEIRTFVRAFAKEIGSTLDREHGLSPVRTTPISRFGGRSWDLEPTIFTFTVSDRERRLNEAELRTLQERLRDPRGASGTRVLLGQPVTIGGAGSALRLSLSAPLIAEALSGPGRGEAVISRAVNALRLAAEMARRLR